MVLRSQQRDENGPRAHGTAWPGRDDTVVAMVTSDRGVAEVAGDEVEHRFDAARRSSTPRCRSSAQRQGTRRQATARSRWSGSLRHGDMAPARRGRRCRHGVFRLDEDMDAAELEEELVVVEAGPRLASRLC